jgi:hypothetical protein
LTRSAAELRAEARSGLQRLTPVQALEGEIAGSWIVPRNAPGTYA